MPQALKLAFTGDGAAEKKSRYNVSNTSLGEGERTEHVGMSIYIPGSTEFPIDTNNLYYLLFLISNSIEVKNCRVGIIPSVSATKWAVRKIDGTEVDTGISIAKNAWTDLLFIPGDGFYINGNRVNIAADQFLSKYTALQLVLHNKAASTAPFTWWYDELFGGLNLHDNFEANTLRSWITVDAADTGPYHSFDAGKNRKTTPWICGHPMITDDTTPLFEIVTSNIGETLHARIEVSTNDTFTNIVKTFATNVSTAGWEYSTDNGATWNSVTGALAWDGITRYRFTVPNDQAINAGTYYVRAQGV